MNSFCLGLDQQSEWENLLNSYSCLDTFTLESTAVRCDDTKNQLGAFRTLLLCFWYFFVVNTCCFSIFKVVKNLLQMQWKNARYKQIRWKAETKSREDAKRSRNNFCCSTKTKVKAPPCIKIGYRGYLPRWGLHLFIKIGYSSAMY